jgi:hypothetical protein
MADSTTSSILTQFLDGTRSASELKKFKAELEALSRLPENQLALTEVRERLKSVADSSASSVLEFMDKVVDLAVKIESGTYSAEMVKIFVTQTEIFNQLIRQYLDYGKLPAWMLA